jgi:perosamine synthetase
MPKRVKIIPITGPSITEKEVKYVSEATRNGWYKNANKYIGEFERKFSSYIGTKYAIATSSCTGALHIALASLGIGKGDEVIVPDITWIATAAAVRYVGARPVFADIEPDTWCIDPRKMEKKITKRTKAVIPVHLYGHPADMAAIMAVAKRHNLRVIEDAAESIGSLYNGRKTGSFGDFSCFSFHGTKILTTGEGGILLTNNGRLYKRAYFLSNQGKSKKPFWNTEVGLKYKMSNMQAALGTVQLSRIEEMIGKKIEIFNWYKERLGDVPGIKLNAERPGCKNNYWMITAILDKKFGLKKEALMKKLLKYGIVSRPFFYPLSSLPPFSEKTNNSVAYSLSPYALHFPCGLNITRSQVGYVCGTLLKILKLK